MNIYSFLKRSKEMHKVITYCIYQFPCAIYDINHWEERFKNHLSKESINFKNFKICFLKERYFKEEIVVCIPFDKGKDNLKSLKDKLDEIKFYLQKDIDYKYNKTVLIGSFTQGDLLSILLFINVVSK